MIALVKRIAVKGTDDCWLWRGSHNNGSGYITVDGRCISVARVVYAMFAGGLLKTQRVSHVCGESLCVNPYHLKQADRFALEGDVEVQIREAEETLARIRDKAACLRMILHRSMDEAQGVSMDEAQRPQLEKRTEPAHEGAGS
jgi:hypothetical protein